MQNITQDYLRDIAHKPLLTKEEQYILGAKIEKLKGLGYDLVKDVPNPDDHTGDERQVVIEGIKAFKDFADGTLRLVVFIAKKYNKHHNDILTLIQFGNMGLLRAIAKFDFSTGYKFSTYAYWWIKQGINRGLTNTGRTIRLPIHISDRLDQIKRVTAEIIQMEGRHKLSEFMIASYINKKFTRSIKYWIYLEVKYPTLFTEFSLVSLTYMYEKLFRLAAEVRFCLDSDYKVSSLNIPLNSDDGSEIQDLIVDNSEELQDIPINPQLKPELIAALRKYLTDKQYYIVIKYFGIGGDSVSMRTIAKRLDISTGEVEGEMQIAMSVLRNKASNLLRFLSEDT